MRDFTCLLCRSIWRWRPTTPATVHIATFTNLQETFIHHIDTYITTISMRVFAAVQRRFPYQSNAQPEKNFQREMLYLCDDGTICAILLTSAMKDWCWLAYSPGWQWLTVSSHTFQYYNMGVSLWIWFARHCETILVSAAVYSRLMRRLKHIDKACRNKYSQFMSTPSASGTQLFSDRLLVAILMCIFAIPRHWWWTIYKRLLVLNSAIDAAALFMLFVAPRWFTGARNISPRNIS